MVQATKFLTIQIWKYKEREGKNLQILTSSTHIQSNFKKLSYQNGVFSKDIDSYFKSHGLNFEGKKLNKGQKTVWD